MSACATASRKKKKKQNSDWTNIKKSDVDEVQKLILSYKKTYTYFYKKTKNSFWKEEQGIIETAIVRLIAKKYTTINKLEDLYKEIKVSINYKQDVIKAMGLSPTNIFINPFTFITRDKCYLSWEKVSKISENEFYYGEWKGPNTKTLENHRRVLFNDDYKSDLTLLDTSKDVDIYQSFYYALIDNQKRVGNDLYIKPYKFESNFKGGYGYDSFKKTKKYKLPIKFNKEKFNSAVKNNPDICFQYEDDDDGQIWMCPKWIYDWEVQASRWLEEYEGFKNPFFEEEEINEFISNYEMEKKIKFHIKQKRVIVNGAKNTFSIITGLPGSGKTEVICCLIRYLKSKIAKCNVSITAPTGKAYKNIEKRCKSELNTNDKRISGTLHKAVYQSYNKIRDWENIVDKGGDRVYVECPWPDVCIVDEMSMCDMEIMWRFLGHMKYFGARGEPPIVIIVGDPNQLPSVGFGDVLNKLVTSNKFCETQLTKNWRSNTAPALSHAIKFMSNHPNEPIPYKENTKFGNWWNHHDSLTFTDIGPMRDIKPTKAGDIEFVNELAKFLKEKKYDPYRDRILAYENKSKININRIVQQHILNRAPGQRIKNEKKFQKELKFYEDGLVIRKKNCESFGSYWTNGEMGRVYKFNKENLEKFLSKEEFRNIVKSECYTKTEKGYSLQNNKIVLTKNRLNEDEDFEIPITAKYEAIVVYEDGVELIKRGELGENFDIGYASTVHKAQGSEFAQVFVWLGCKSWADYGGKKRKPFYTAISRGILCCHVIGDWNKLPLIQKLKINNIKSFFLDY